MQFIKKHKIISIIILLLILFGSWNLIWYVTVQNRYEPFLKAVPEIPAGTHVTNEGSFTYNVKTPGYLSYTGNLGISDFDRGLSLIIWPLMNGDYKYGVRIIGSDGMGYELMMDENQQLIDSADETAVRVAEENKELIKEVYTKANEKFDLK